MLALRSYLQDEMPEDAEVPVLIGYLDTYQILQRHLPELNAGSTYFLLMTELRSNVRPSFVSRLQRRLRAAVVEDLNQLFEELPQHARLDLGE